VVRLPVLLTPFLKSASGLTEVTNANGPSLRVLVVDDNIDAAQTIGMLLQAKGHEVRTAYNGPAALEAAVDFQPTVVLLDIGLPGLDGLEVAKRLRKQIGSRNAVLIAMTGYGQEADRERSLVAGFDHHLVKPIHFEKVQEILATVSQE
jgi:CheY-like chemotaxis protein